MDRSTKLRIGGLVVLLFVSIAGGLALRTASEPQAPRFCKASLPIKEIDGRTVAIQDRDPDGTACDLGQTMRGMDTLGTDCKVRSPDGTVLSVETSSRSDGTCGRDSPSS